MENNSEPLMGSITLVKDANITNALIADNNIDRQIDVDGKTYNLVQIIEINGELNEKVIHGGMMGRGGPGRGGPPGPPPGPPAPGPFSAPPTRPPRTPQPPPSSVEVYGEFWNIINAIIVSIRDYNNIRDRRGVLNLAEPGRNRNINDLTRNYEVEIQRLTGNNNTAVQVRKTRAGETMINVYQYTPSTGQFINTSHHSFHTLQPPTRKNPWMGQSTHPFGDESGPHHTKIDFIAGGGGGGPPARDPQYVVPLVWHLNYDINNFPGHPLFFSVSQLIRGGNEAVANSPENLAFVEALNETLRTQHSFTVVNFVALTIPGVGSATSGGMLSRLITNYQEEARRWEDARAAAEEAARAAEDAARAAEGKGTRGGKSLRKKTKKTRKTRRTKKTKKTRKHKRQ
jgi:hypothetical protein